MRHIFLSENGENRVISAIKILLIRVRLHLNQDSSLQIPIAFAGVIQELIACRKNDGRVVAILDVETCACAPEHLIVLTEQVSKITCCNRQHGSPYREANPKASR